MPIGESRTDYLCIAFLTEFSIGQLYEIRLYIKEEVCNWGVFGDSPFSLSPHPEISNPVLTFRDVSDYRRILSLIRYGEENGVWYMFSRC